MRLRTDRDRGLSRLRALSLFSACTDRELRLVSALTTELEIEAGRVLVDPERWERQVFVIAEGTAEVRIGARVLARLEPGALFGELALRPIAEPTIKVSALTPMIVFVLTELEWRSLPEPLRVAADRLRVESARLPRGAEQFDAEADAVTARVEQRLPDPLVALP